MASAITTQGLSAFLYIRQDSVVVGWNRDKHSHNMIKSDGREIKEWQKGNKRETKEWQKGNKRETKEKQKRNNRGILE